MQPRFSIRNYVWFIAAWMGMTFLYVTYWRPKMVPPAKPEAKQDEPVWKYAGRSKETQAEVLAHLLLSAPGTRGIVDAIDFAAEYAALPDARVEALVKKPAPPKPVEAPQGPPTEVVLGGDGFSIKAI